MYGKKFYRRRPRKYIRRRRVIRRRTVVPSRIRRYVKKAIHRQIENKCVINYAANQPIEAGNRTLISWPLIVGTAQGDADNQRVGNTVKIVHGTWKMFVNLLPYNVTTNPSPLPVWVKLWVVRDLRVTGQLTSIDSTSFSKFFRENGGSLPLQNNPLDLTLAVNNDMFRVVYSRVFKLGATFTNINASNVPNNNASYCDMSPMSKSITINYAKWCKKSLKYDDNLSTLPINENLYLVIQPVYATGDDTTSKRPIEIHYTNTMKYEDA